MRLIISIFTLTFATSAAADCSFGSLEEGTDWRTPYIANGIPLNEDTLFVGYHPDEITEEQRTDVLVPRARGILHSALKEAELGVEVVTEPENGFSVIRLHSHFDAVCNAASISSIPIVLQE